LLASLSGTVNTFTFSTDYTTWEQEGRSSLLRPIAIQSGEWLQHQFAAQHARQARDASTE